MLGDRHFCKAINFGAGIFGAWRYNSHVCVSSSGAHHIYSLSHCVANKHVCALCCSCVCAIDIVTLCVCILYGKERKEKYTFCREGREEEKAHCVPLPAADI